MTQPQIWHHGLIARDWAEFQTDGGIEADYFKRLVELTNGPALDLGCGTGRLLIPFLHANLDVDGCDFSKDMLDLCWERGSKEGLAPHLYQQAMHELDLPRRYKTIYACGVMGLGGNRQLTRQAMRCCYEHLHSGGVFAFDLVARWNDPPAWLSRLPDNRHSLPEQWPESTPRSLLSDGTELEIAARTVEVNPLEETQARQLRARLWRDGELLDEQIHTMLYEEYGKNEIMLMIELAGFRDIQIFGDYTDEPATPDSRQLIFVSKK